MSGNGLPRGTVFKKTDPALEATEGQTVFTVTFSINRVWVDGAFYADGYSGGGTDTITFDIALFAGQMVYLTT